jgi:hypothetical protein
MYTGHSSQSDFTTEWMMKTNDFLELAFDESAKGAFLILCPCKRCANRKRKNKVDMDKHLLKNGFTQVHQPLRPWHIKSGVASWYMCWTTLTRWRHTLGKFSMNLFQYAITISHPTPCFTLVQGIYSSLLESIKGSYPVGSWYPSFKGCGTREAQFYFLVQKQSTFEFSSYLVRPSKLLVR